MCYVVVQYLNGNDSLFLSLSFFFLLRLFPLLAFSSECHVSLSFRDLTSVMFPMIDGQKRRDFLVKVERTRASKEREGHIHIEKKNPLLLLAM